MSALRQALNGTPLLLFNRSTRVSTLDDVDVGCHLIEIGGSHVLLVFKTPGNPAIVIDPSDGEVYRFDSKTFNSKFGVVDGGKSTYVFELTVHEDVTAAKNMARRVKALRTEVGNRTALELSLYNHRHPVPSDIQREDNVAAPRSKRVCNKSTPSKEPIAGCFNADVKVRMADGGWGKAYNLKIGEKIANALIPGEWDTVVHVLPSTSNGKHMVVSADGRFYITWHHPIVVNGIMMTPETAAEMYPDKYTLLARDEVAMPLMNLVTEHGSVIDVDGQYKVSTLGGGEESPSFRSKGGFGFNPDQEDLAKYVKFKQACHKAESTGDVSGETYRMIASEVGRAMEPSASPAEEVANIAMALKYPSKVLETVYGPGDRPEDLPWVCSSMAILARSFTIVVAAIEPDSGVREAIKVQVSGLQV
jgi:hypothetical protein